MTSDDAVVGTTFTVSVDADVRAFGRAFLVYELQGLPHWSAALRRINGLSIHGLAPVAGARGGLQVEEISVGWLRAGPNEVTFFPADPVDPVGYGVRNLRIVAVPPAADAIAPAEAVASAQGRLLIDGRADTGVRTSRRGASTVVDLPLARRAQPQAVAVQVSPRASGKVDD